MPDSTKKNRLPLHMGLPPSQVPFTSGAVILRQSDLKKKFVFNFRVYTRLVAYTKIITDSFRVFDRGRLPGHNVPHGLHPPVHLPAGEDN